MTSTVPIHYSILGNFIPDGAKTFAIGFVKADLECCLPPSITLNAVQDYKHEQLKKYDYILVNSFDAELSSQTLTELFQSEKIINVVTRTKLPLDSLRETLETQQYIVNALIPFSEKLFVYQFKPATTFANSPIKIAILYQSSQLQDLLGLQLLKPLLPENSEIIDIELGQNQFDDYDFVILGTGSILTQIHFSPALINLLEKTPISIGLFGTQFRDQIISQDIKRVIASLNLWCALSLEDYYLYSQFAKDSLHLGHWYLLQTSITKPSIEKALTIKNESLTLHPLHKTIENIQKYKAVHSQQCAPLAIALNSAEDFSYLASQSNAYSETFRSLFIDIYGLNFPEKSLISNNKNKVIEYRAHLKKQYHTLQQTLVELFNK